MANTTKQQTAIAMAATLISLNQQLQALRNSAAAFIQANTDFSPDTLWRQMTTAAVNADGSISITPDESPTLTNPITVSGLNRAEADLLTGLTLMIELGEFLGGTLPTNRAATNRNPTIDTLAG